MRTQMPRRSANPFESSLRDLIVEIALVVAAVMVSAGLMAVAYGAAV